MDLREGTARHVVRNVVWTTFLTTSACIAADGQRTEFNVDNAVLSFKFVDMGAGQKHLYLCIATQEKFATDAQVKFTYSMKDHQIGVNLSHVLVSKAFLKQPEPARAEVDVTDALVEIKDESAAPGPAYSSTLKTGTFLFNVNEFGTGSSPARVVGSVAFEVKADAKGTMTVNSNDSAKKENTVTLTLPARHWKIVDGKLTEDASKSEDF
jgi:hypothetical protein